jgi:hypothetical protein
MIAVRSFVALAEYGRQGMVSAGFHFVGRRGGLLVFIDPQEAETKGKATHTLSARRRIEK